MTKEGAGSSRLRTDSVGSGRLFSQQVRLVRDLSDYRHLSDYVSVFNRRLTRRMAACRLQLLHPTAPGSGATPEPEVRRRWRREKSKEMRTGPLQDKSFSDFWGREDKLPSAEARERAQLRQPGGEKREKGGLRHAVQVLQEEHHHHSGLQHSQSDLTIRKIAKR